MIIEFFGLSNTGKSVLKKNLEKKGYPTYNIEKSNLFAKFFFFFKHFLLHPIKTKYLFYKLNTNNIKLRLGVKKRFQIFKMRNSYLAFVLAKYEQMKNKKQIFTDEFSYQSLFMILQKKSNEKEIKKILNALPKSDFLFLFNGNKELRYRAYAKPHPKRKGTLLPGSGIDTKYAESWMNLMEYNIEIIKKIIEKDFISDKQTFGKLKLGYPKVYKRKKDN